MSAVKRSISPSLRGVFRDIDYGEQTPALHYQFAGSAFSKARAEMQQQQTQFAAMRA